MGVPSSPPILPDLEPPSSPPLPAAAFLPLVSNLRKRQLPEDESSLSSDPLFSEEPSEAEDSALYCGQRRKKMIKGPWWFAESSQAQAEVKKEVVEKTGDFRNMDSGVFMGSDPSSDMGIDTTDRSLPTTNRLQRLRRFAEQPYRAVTRPVMSATQPEADKIINHAVDTGKETFDLSNLGLTTLSSATLAPVRNLTRQMHNHLAHAPSEDEMRPLTPEIKLFLANNQLCRVPPEVFQIPHLIALSLRNNELTELSHAIGRLRGSLTELNVAGNSIEVLPWELLDFFVEDKRITVRPNPLLEIASVSDGLATAILPALSQDLQQQITETSDYHSVLVDMRQQHCQEHGELDMSTELQLRLAVGRAVLVLHWKEAVSLGAKPDLRRKQLIFLAPSQVKYYHASGTPCHRLAPDWNFPVEFNHSMEMNSDEAESDAPSLFECALQAVQKEYQLDNLPTTLPVAVDKALRAASDAAKYGNPQCTTCGRSFIIARAEWVEYWFNGPPGQVDPTPEMILPFKRQACSWRCVKPSVLGDSRYWDGSGGM